MNASLDPIHMPQRTVAVIGGGPAGLVAARFLKKHGFDPVVFEAAAAVGGQWNAGSPSSAVWPGMCTNTSRVLTAFSDLDHLAGTSVYPSQVDMLAYLQQIRREGRPCAPSPAVDPRRRVGSVCRERLDRPLATRREHRIGTLFARRGRDGLLHGA